MVMPAPGAVKALPRRLAPTGLFRRDTARPVADPLSWRDTQGTCS